MIGDSSSSDESLSTGFKMAVAVIGSHDGLVSRRLKIRHFICDALSSEIIYVNGSNTIG